MIVPFILALGVFVVLLGLGGRALNDHFDERVGFGAVCLVLATVLGHLLVLVTYAEIG